jgi:hypothetical protein
MRMEGSGLGRLPRDVLRGLCARVGPKGAAALRATCHELKQAVDSGPARWVLAARDWECDGWGGDLEECCKRAQGRMARVSSRTYRYRCQPVGTDQVKSLAEAVAVHGLTPYDSLCTGERLLPRVLDALGGGNRAEPPDLIRVDMGDFVCHVKRTVTSEHPSSVAVFGAEHLLVASAERCGRVLVWRLPKCSGQQPQLICERDHLFAKQWDTCTVAPMVFPVFAVSSGSKVFCEFNAERAAVDVVMKGFNVMHPDPLARYHFSSLGTENLLRMCSGRVLAEYYYEHDTVAFWALGADRKVPALLLLPQLMLMSGDRFDWPCAWRATMCAGLTRPMVWCVMGAALLRSWIGAAKCSTSWTLITTTTTTRRSMSFLHISIKTTTPTRRLRTIRHAERPSIRVSCVGRQELVARASATFSLQTS